MRHASPPGLANRCPGCGEEFVAVWQLAIGASQGGYKPVFGGPVVLNYGRANAPTWLLQWLGERCSHSLHVCRLRYDYAEFTTDVFGAGWQPVPAWRRSSESVSPTLTLAGRSAIILARAGS